MKKIITMLKKIFDSIILIIEYIIAIPMIVILVIPIFIKSIWNHLYVKRAHRKSGAKINTADKEIL